MRRRSMDEARRTRGGFSLLEVLISVAILSFGLLTVALMQVYALSQGSMGRHTGDAAAVARSYVEQINRVPWTVLTGAVGAGWQNPSWAAAPATWNNAMAAPDGATYTERAYAVQWRVTAVAGTTCLRDVELRVTWNEEEMSAPKQTTLATRRYDWGGASC